MAKLNESSYWRWRHKIEEMHHSESKLKMTRMQYSSMEKDIENMKLKAQVYTQTIKAHENSCETHKREYEDIKLKLESEVGHSLNGCTVDDVTYEVTKLEDEPLKE